MTISSPSFPPFPSPLPSFPSPTLNSNKEALLALPGLNPRALQNRIRTRNANPFRRSRRLQMQHVRLTKLRARRLERVADREEDAAAHEERGFAW